MVACGQGDVPAVLRTINSAAMAYEGAIPADCWREPYMSAEELASEMRAGVTFLASVSGGRVVGVMGAQDVKDVTLVRHAYVLPSHQRRGIGGALLKALMSLTERPVLVGTWAAATWAVRFYEGRGFSLVHGRAEAMRLLREYWRVPARQMRASVVLADGRWRARERSGSSSRGRDLAGLRPGEDRRAGAPPGAGGRTRPLRVDAGGRGPAERVNNERAEGAALWRTSPLTTSSS